MDEKVKASIIKAFSDRHRDKSFAERRASMEERNLDFRSLQITLDDWHSIMSEACPNYGLFNVNQVYEALVFIIDDSCKVEAAREGSVALYIYSTNSKILVTIQALAFATLCADEADIKEDHIRLWWD